MAFVDDASASSGRARCNTHSVIHVVTVKKRVEIRICEYDLDTLPQPVSYTHGEDLFRHPNASSLGLQLEDAFTRFIRVPHTDAEQH